MSLVCMYVWSSHIARVRINRVRLPILLVVSWTGKMNFSLSPFAPESLVSRDGGPALPSRVSLLISILRLNLVLTYGILPSSAAVSIYSLKSPYAIRSAPRSSGHVIAYRWRSLSRVRRHRASKPQGNSKRVLPWQVTMDQVICASLSHTRYWYEVGMLKVRHWCGGGIPFIPVRPWLDVHVGLLRCPEK